MRLASELKGTTLLFASALLSLAPALGWAYGTTNTVTITTLTIYMAANTTGALVKFTPANPSGLTGCTYTTGDYVFIDFSATGNPNGRDLYASLLAATMAGKQVDIGTLGCGDGGYYPLAYGVNVYP